MRIYWLLAALLTSIGMIVAPYSQAEESLGDVKLATHHQSAKIDALALERIRKIVLNQGDDSRALANLVQLARDLPEEAGAQLYADLADDYLKLGRYNQAANLMQQLLNQYGDQAVAERNLVKLLQLYSSGEVNHTQTSATASSARAKQGESGFLRYASHLANTTVQKNPRLADSPALHFQRGVIARRSGQTQTAQGWLTKLKHNSAAGAWRSCARVEEWLLENREGEAVKPVVLCSRTESRPHLDGVLNESLWQAGSAVQLAYDHEYLYVGVRYPKVAGLTYQKNSKPRSYDTDLSKHDHVRLRLDLDRDYATYFELSVDHRGHTSDRCWLAKDWNPQWFVAAGKQTQSTHWTVEAAIPWEELTREAPQTGTAWAISAERVVPADSKRGRESLSRDGHASSDAFSLLLFE